MDISTIAAQDATPTPTLMITGITTLTQTIDIHTPLQTAAVTTMGNTCK